MIASNEAYLKLKERGFRLTKLREQLIDFILRTKGHWTIKSLSDDAMSAIPKVGIATIYRTVNLLVEEGFLTRTILETGIARFEVTPTDHHDHLTCTLCGHIVEFENEKIEELQKKIAKRFGFVLTDHRMELYGECVDRSSCQKRSRKSQKN